MQRADSTEDHGFAAVVFDMDGVLLDSEPLHHIVLNEVLASEGRQLSFEEYRPYIGTTLEYTWSDLIRRFDLKGPVDQYILRYDEGILESYRRHSVIAPGVRQLLDLLTEQRLRRAVASSSRTSWVEAALETLGIRAEFELIVTGDMVTHSKPHPEIYLLAADRLGIDPRRCLAVEDSPAGTTSASTAGMAVIGVRTEYTSHTPLAGAAIVLDTLEEFTDGVLQSVQSARFPPASP